MDEKNSSRTSPTIWKTFERCINGELKQFWIQDLPENDFDLALDYLCKYYLRDEPMCRALEAANDEEIVKFARVYWRKGMTQKHTLACFTKNENGKNELVAINCCVVRSITEECNLKMENEKVLKVFGNLGFLRNLKDIFQEFNIDSYLGAFGLLTLPEYRGHNLGLELLNCRKLLCNALGLKVSCTVFTSPASQKIAEKAGFKDLATISFEEISKREPSLIIPNIELYSKILKNMYILNE